MMIISDLCGRRALLFPYFQQKMVKEIRHSLFLVTCLFPPRLPSFLPLRPSDYEQGQ